MKNILQLLLVLFLFQICNSQNIQNLTFEKKLKAVDKIEDKNPQKEKILTKLMDSVRKLKDDEKILSSGYMLQRLYFNQHKYDKVISLGSELKHIASLKKDKNGIISNIYRQNGLSLGYIGLFEESRSEFKSAIRSAEHIEDQDLKNYNLSLCFDNINVINNFKAFDKKAYRDSTIININKSIYYIKKISDKSKTISRDYKYDQIGFNKMRLGIFYLEQIDTEGSLESAEKYLHQALYIYENSAYKIPIRNKTMLYNQMSWLYVEKKEYNKAIDFANRAMALEKKYRNPYNRVESFEFLATCYTETGDKEKAKLYLRMYSNLKDSLSFVEKNIADKSIEKKESDVKNAHQNDSHRQMLFFILVIVFIIFIGIVFWVRKNHIMKIKYNQLLKKIEDGIQNNTTEEEVKSKISSSKTITNTDTEKRILGDLMKFENSQDFLSKDFTSVVLANLLNTNTKYLAEVIKNHRNQNYNDYINSLKIKYIVNKLYYEPKYRDFKVSHLADLCGYSSPQVFAIAFKRINGVNPSYFIQKLKEENINEN